MNTNRAAAYSPERVILRHVTAGDHYVADLDEDGTVIAGIGPVHHLEQAALLAEDAVWDSDPDLVDELNGPDYVRGCWTVENFEQENDR